MRKLGGLPPEQLEGRFNMLLFSVVQGIAADAARALRRGEEGQTMAEYGIVLAVITLAVIAAITLLGGNISNALNSVANVLP
jgi:pilus assembly protein Flp/PilA